MIFECSYNIEVNNFDSAPFVVLCAPIGPFALSLSTDISFIAPHHTFGYHAFGSTDSATASVACSRTDKDGSIRASRG